MKFRNSLRNLVPKFLFAPDGEFTTAYLGEGFADEGAGELTEFM
jgi:hypothetical protein